MIRVLNVFKHITGGGVESWLLHVVRNMDHDRFQMDIAVRDNLPNHFDKLFELLGCRVHHFTRPPLSLTYAGEFRAILSESGPYDVVHCHSVFNRGVVLRLAHQAGVPVRIAHSHNAPTTDSSAIRRIRVAHRARSLARLWTNGVACSRPAAAELFGVDWEQNSRVRILYCGVDLSPFHSAPDRDARTELGVPEDSFVVGHVGRFNEQKNHTFLVDIAEEVISRDSNVWFVLIGEGEEKEGIQRSVAKRRLAHRFVFEGHRDDIPRLMLGAFDMFLLPSFHEGLPLVGMEAQAAGLPMVVSDVITTEMDGVTGLIRRLSLNQTAAEWAATILEIKLRQPAVERCDALGAMERGPFNIESSVGALQSFYEECVRAAYRRGGDAEKR